MVSRAWPVVALLLLAACTQAAPQPGVTTTPLGAMTERPIAEAEAAIVARLHELGFTVENRPDTGVVSAVIERGAPIGWAFCDRVQVHERDDRSRVQWADPNGLAVQVNVRLSELGGRTSVTVGPRFNGLYLDRFDNLPFERACASAGVLEPMILASASGG